MTWDDVYGLPEHKQGEESRRELEDGEVKPFVQLCPVP